MESSQEKPVHTNEEFEISTSKDDLPTISRSIVQLCGQGFKPKELENNRYQIVGKFRMIVDMGTGETWSYVTPRDE